MATATYAGDTGLGKLAALVLGAVGWIVTNYLAKPMLEIDHQCRQALQVAEANTFIRHADDQWITNARQTIDNAGTILRSYARTSTWPVRLYCQLRGYDLEWPARMMFRLGNVAGDGRYRDTHLQDHLDALHVCLNATSHLTPERVAKVKQMLADASAESQHR